MRRRIALTLLLAVSLVQLWVNAQDLMLPTLARIWRMRDRSAYERSALLSFGEDFLQYMEFVKAHVPEQASLVIPKEAQIGIFGNRGMMQFFAFPRTIIDCPLDSVQQCILGLGGSMTYILAPDSRFPPPEVALQVKTFLPFEADRGLFVP